MAVAAVPEYLGSNFDDAFPGMRFGLLLELWGEDKRENKLLWGTHDLEYEARGREREERSVKKENKTSAICKAAKLNKEAKSLCLALATRQRLALEHLEESDQLSRLSVYAKSTAPFITGLGNEHPLENGFSFLNPYALPYLPGSGVKGALRRAAQELADGIWGDNKGWSDNAITQLFGPEPHQLDASKESLSKGALSFWDVFPQVQQDRLDVEVMTPHQTHYYQDGKPPHDSGQPNPIAFLAVPSQSKFAFHVTCDVKRIDNDLVNEDRWRKLVEAAFNHAFEWVGFGAKTAVGYGAMALDEEEVERYEKAQMEKRKEGEIKKATEGKPDDVAWIICREEKWSGREQFLDDMDDFFNQFPSDAGISKEAYEKLQQKFSEFWRGILDNPDAVKGKKKKPKYSSKRAVSNAKNLLKAKNKLLN